MRLRTATLFFLSALLASQHAMAQAIPGQADPGRIDSRIEEKFSPRNRKQPMQILQGSSPATADAPAGAEDIHFTLKQVRIEGNSAFTEGAIQSTYAHHLNQEITLATVWQIAADITQLYRDNEYFLSRAYVPAQEIEDGSVTIRIIEGHVGHVNIPDQQLADLSIIRKLVKQLIATQPIRASEIESFILRVNDLPGASFRAILTLYEEGAEDEVAVQLVPFLDTSQGLISFDNYGSRYLGPYQATATYSTTFHPLHQTVFSASTTGNQELAYGALAHRVALTPTTDLQLSGSYVSAEPGYTLDDSDVQSESVEMALAFNWRPIRQWRRNLSFSAQIDGKNTTGDILGSPLTRDRIRTVRAGVTFDNLDNWNGSNYADLTVSRGLTFLGASDANSPNLSRAEAEPDFTKVEANMVRQQALGTDYSIIGSLSGQYASKQLFSSEEFGYGGQRFGRAYDPSEITGDHGVAASVELRYQALPGWEAFSFAPYVFYDIGKVWNIDTGMGDASGSSTGLGIRIYAPNDITATFSLAKPLTREQEAPHYGTGKDPRLLFELTYGF